MPKKIHSLLIILINYFSLLYLATGLSLIYYCDFTAIKLLYFVLLWLYLLPPLFCRLLITLFARPTGTVTSGSGVFLYWWLLTQLQIIYVRFPFLEELLRIIPGAYNLWLMLWGAKVSLLTYWSPSVTVTDRYDINIGRASILGGGCRIGAHLLTLSDTGLQQLTLAPVTIEDHCIIGLHSAIGPGSHVYSHETLPAGKILKPFYSWKDGKIHKPAHDI